MDTEPSMVFKKEPAMSPLDKWSRIDTVDWFAQYGANRDQIERLVFSNVSELLSMLNSNLEEYAKILGMATSALLQACKSLDSNCNNTHSYLPTGHLYTNGELYITIQFSRAINFNKDPIPVDVCSLELH